MAPWLEARACGAAGAGTNIGQTEAKLLCFGNLRKSNFVIWKNGHDSQIRAQGLSQED